ARVFKGAEVMMNKVGMAPGMILPFEERTWIFLPGVPKEMRALMTNDVLPYLHNTLIEQTVIISEMLHFIGIGESALEHQLHDVIEKQTNPTIAPLAQDTGVGVRLTAKAQNHDAATASIKQIKKVILDKVGSHYIGSNLSGIAEMTIQLLKRREMDIAAAESLTGGLF